MHQGDVDTQIGNTQVQPEPVVEELSRLLVDQRDIGSVIAADLDVDTTTIDPRLDLQHALDAGKALPDHMDQRSPCKLRGPVVELVNRKHEMGSPSRRDELHDCQTQRSNGQGQPERRQDPRCQCRRAETGYHVGNLGAPAFAQPAGCFGDEHSAGRGDDDDHQCLGQARHSSHATRLRLALPVAGATVRRFTAIGRCRWSTSSCIRSAT